MFVFVFVDLNQKYNFRPAKIWFKWLYQCAIRLLIVADTQFCLILPSVRPRRQKQLFSVKFHPWHTEEIVEWTEHDTVVFVLLENVAYVLSLNWMSIVLDSFFSTLQIDTDIVASLFAPKISKNFEKNFEKYAQIKQWY